MSRMCKYKRMKIFMMDHSIVLLTVILCDCVAIQPLARFVPCEKHEKQAISLNAIGCVQFSRAKLLND